MRLLPPHQGSLESLGQIDAVHGILGTENVPRPEHVGIVNRLVMNELCKFQKILLSSYVVEPVQHLKIVRRPPFSPVAPVSQRRGGQIGFLIAEVAVEHLEHAPVTAGLVVLLQYLEGHHLGPPVPGFPALQALDVRMVGAIAEIALGGGGAYHRLGPAQRFGNQRLIVQQISQGQQAVDPVGAALPGVPVAAYPGIVVPDNLGIQFIQMPGGAGGLPLQLLQKPALGLYGTQGKVGVISAREGGAVEDLRSGRKAPEQAQDRQKLNSFHIVHN